MSQLEPFLFVSFEADPWRSQERPPLVTNNSCLTLYLVARCEGGSIPKTSKALSKGNRVERLGPHGAG